MQDNHEFKDKLWKAIKSDRTVMLGLVGIEEGHTRPMTGMLDGEGGPVWFFTAKDHALVKNLGNSNRAIATFASKGHDLFASIHGTLRMDNDRAVIDRLWNPMIAAWYEGGKDDPKLALLRFDTESAEIWKDASSIIAGVKMLLGVDPKKSYKDKVAEVSLDKNAA